MNTKPKTQASLERLFHDHMAHVLIEDHAMVVSGGSIVESCKSFVDFMLEKMSFKLVHIWSIDPRRELMILKLRKSNNPQADAEINNRNDDTSKGIMGIGNSLSGLAVEEGRPSYFELDKQYSGRVFNQPSLKSIYDINRMLSIPIRNICNPHHIPLVINCFRKSSQYNEFIQDDFQFDEKLLDSIARIIAVPVEANIRERANRSSSLMSRCLSLIKEVNQDQVLSTLASVSQTVLKADQVNVYSKTWDNSNLRLVAQSMKGLKSNNPQNTLSTQIPQNVYQAWKNNREELGPPSVHNDNSHPLQDYAKMSEIQDSAEFVIVEPNLAIDDLLSEMLVPIQNLNREAIGVIHCINYYSHTDNHNRWGKLFTYEDIAIVESMCQTIVPYTENLIRAERNELILQKMSHELRVPVIAIRNAVWALNREIKNLPYSANLKFLQRHINDLSNYSEIFRIQLKELEHARIDPQNIVIKPQTTHLFNDVIIPAKKIMQPLLAQRQMIPTQLWTTLVGSIPKMQLDKSLLTNVIFNLIENAIKYYPSDQYSSNFKCDIVCGMDQQCKNVEVCIEDNGRGISTLDAETIFDYGVRGTDAHDMDVSGTGIGLAISRNICRAHGGDLSLVSNVDPTRFKICLPIK